MRTTLVLMLLACGTPLLGQQWDGLRDLNPGDHVRVLDTLGDERKGAFASFTPDSISVRAGNGEVRIDRAKVRLVQVRSGSRRVRRLGIGAAIGVAVGVAIDQTLGRYLRNETGEDSGVRAATYAAPIALFGGIGAALPAYRTVYRVK